MAASVGKKDGGVPALGWWFMAVGTARLAFTWSCSFGSKALCSATYSRAQMTGVHGRTVGVWTLLSSTLSFLCALDHGSRPIYAATFLSFYGLVYLAAECLYAAKIDIAFVSCRGILVWIMLQWNSHGHGTGPRAATKHP